MKAPVGLLSDRTVLRQQDGGAPPRQVPRLRAQRSNESPSGAFKRQNGLAQQDGGASPRQVSRLRAQRSNESPSGAFKRQNGPASAGWRGPAPTSSYMFFLDKHPAGVLSLQHRDRAPADGTLWSTTVQLCGESQCRPSGQPCAIAAQSCPFLLSRRMSDENRYRDRTGS